MAASLYLIIDQGGQSTRATLYNHQGRVISQSSAPVSIIYSAESYIEHHCDELIASVQLVINTVLNTLDCGQRKNIQAGLVTQRSSMVCWNRASGAFLSPVISWQDTRGHYYFDGMSDQNKTRITALTGLVANAHYGATKMRWCLDNLPAVHAAALNNELLIAPVASFLVWALTGNIAVDPANASRTLLMNLNDRIWDQQLLELFSIPENSLPSITETTADYGVIKDLGIPLRLVNGDQSAAFNGYGALEEGTVYINAGSGAFIASQCKPEIPCPKGLLISPVYCVSNLCKLVCEGTVNGAANALQYYAQKFELADYRAMDLRDKLYKNMPLFLNGVGGLGAPYWQPDFKSRFIGGGDSWQKMLAVMESIAFLLAVNLEVMIKAGMPAKKIYLSGGLSHSYILADRLAIICGLPLYLSADAERTSLGAAFQLAGFPRSWELPAMTRFTQKSGVYYESTKGHEQRVLQRFERWRYEMQVAVEGGNKIREV